MLKFIGKLIGHEWSSPKFFYEKTKFISTLLMITSIILLTLGLSYGLWFSPIDYQQQEAFKIIYVHVPVAFASLSIYVIIGVMSFTYLVWRIKLADIIATASAPVGASFTLLALLTGSIWGKPMWGTWWVWDARLTSELILLFLYFGYMGLRSAIIEPKKAAKACAIIGVIGLIDIPIIHFSVQWWQTLHQGPTLSKFSKPEMATEMLIPLLIMIIGFYIFFVSCILCLSRAEILSRERRQLWVQRILIAE